MHTPLDVGQPVHHSLSAFAHPLMSCKCRELDSNAANTTHHYHIHTNLLQLYQYSRIVINGTIYLVYGFWKSLHKHCDNFHMSIKYCFIQCGGGALYWRATSQASLKVNSTCVFSLHVFVIFTHDHKFMIINSICVAACILIVGKL